MVLLEIWNKESHIQLFVSYMFSIEVKPDAQANNEIISNVTWK